MLAYFVIQIIFDFLIGLFLVYFISTKCSYYSSQISDLARQMTQMTFRIEALENGTRVADTPQLPITDIESVKHEIDETATISHILTSYAFDHSPIKQHGVTALTLTEIEEESEESIKPIEISNEASSELEPEQNDK